jgi:hypothetical protein
MESTRRPTKPLAPGPATPDETLVVDARSGLTPSQHVERKLESLLEASPLLISHLQTARARRPVAPAPLAARPG